MTAPSGAWAVTHVRVVVIDSTHNSPQELLLCLRSRASPRGPDRLFTPRPTSCGPEESHPILAVRHALATARLTPGCLHGTEYQCSSLSDHRPDPLRKFPD
jgi:hypothetical protein